MFVETAAETLAAGKADPIQLEGFGAFKDSHLSGLQNLFYLFCAAALIVVVSQHRDHWYVAIPQFPREPLGLFRQTKMGQVTAKREDISITRNLADDLLNGVAGIFVDMYVADGGNAELMRICAHSPPPRRPRIRGL